MTLLEAQNLTAQSLGYKDWDTLLQTKIMDETARIPGLTKTAAIAIMKIPVE